MTRAAPGRATTAGSGRTGPVTTPAARSTTPAASVAGLEARIRELEAERHRIFEDAQREADAVFSQYQLSQLLAAGGTVEFQSPGASAPTEFVISLPAPT